MGELEHALELHLAGRLVELLECREPAPGDPVHPDAPFADLEVGIDIGVAP